MIHVGVDLSFEYLSVVLAATVLEVDRNKEKIANPGPKDDVEQIKVRNYNFPGQLILIFLNRRSKKAI